ncbi:MAG: hypothetical protein JSU86_05400 [Phycisphaerales bacterium]|nr:MAG: hypothetical protein JSU86_05400 [Phycisphaerales bacterium]
MKDTLGDTIDVTIRFKFCRLACVMLAIFGFAPAGYADEFELTKTVVSGSGGRMSDWEGNFVVTFTIGQPAAGATGGGDFELGVGFFPPPPPCLAAAAPQPDRLDLPSNPINQKVRYLSFSVSDVGQQQAIRVTMVDLPAPYDSWNGTKMFVGPPQTFCENAGKVSPPCPEVIPVSEFKGATLQCAAEIREWSVEGVVHVYHEGIIPGARYDVQAADGGCDLGADGSYSDPLVVTMSRWGDLVKSCAAWPCTPPDGIVGIPTDVTAVLDKFKNLGPPLYNPAVVKVRADLDWETPNQRIDISDVTFCLDAFRPLPPPAPPYPPPAFNDPSPPPWEPGGECY